MARAARRHAKSDEGFPFWIKSSEASRTPLNLAVMAVEWLRIRSERGLLEPQDHQKVKEVLEAVGHSAPWWLSISFDRVSVGERDREKE